MTRTFSVTREGIHIPYRTFLADSATGLVLILFLLACYRFPVVTQTPLMDLMGPGGLGIGAEVKVFVLFAAFLLATPAGFALNAISWVLLDQAVDTVMQFLSRGSGDVIYPVWSIKAARQVELLRARFGAQEESFTATGWFLRELLEAPQLSSFAPVTNAQGLLILLRNITVLVLMTAAVSLYSAHGAEWAGWLVTLAAICGCLALTLRWQRPPVAAIAGVISILLSASLIVGKSGDRFGIQALVLGFVAIVLVVVQGVIAYYHNTLIMLNAYFAACSTDVSLPTSSHPTVPPVMSAASEILRKALQLGPTNR